MNLNKKLYFKWALRGLIIYSILFSFMHFVVYKQVALSSIYYYIDNVNTSTTREKIDTLTIIYDFKRGSHYSIKIKYIDEPEFRYDYDYDIRKQDLSFSNIYKNSISIGSIKNFEEDFDVNSLKNEIYVHTHREDIFNEWQHYKLRISIPYTFWDYMYNLFE